jgi:DNA-binding transcriptional ArsR family regulator
MPSREPERAQAARLDAVFTALADGTRRAVVDRLAEQPASASELARDAPVSRQAIVKHLSVLEAAGLVAGERDGRRVVYRFTPSPLRDAAAWMGAVGADWDDRLARLRKLMAR